VNESLRQYIHDYMADNAARHAAWTYPGLGGGTAGQLFALLTDVALAYLMEAEAELADPGPGQSPRRRRGPVREGDPARGAQREPRRQERRPGRHPGQPVDRLARRPRPGHRTP